MKNNKKNKRIKVNVEGTEFYFTEGQIEAMILSKNKDSDVFKRVNNGEMFFYTSAFGTLEQSIEINDKYCDTLYELGNYSTNESFLKKKKEQEILNQLLKKFTIENGWRDEFWYDLEMKKYYIVYSYKYQKYYIFEQKDNLRYINEIYFINKQIAQRALNEIIIPFQNKTLPICKLLETIK